MLESSCYRRDEFSKQIVKAQDIVMELIASLNFDAGDLARNLWKLYDYIAWQLRRADLNKDVHLIDDVMYHMTSLRNAWRQVIQQPTAQAVPSAPQYPQSYARSSMVA